MGGPGARRPPCGPARPLPCTAGTTDTCPEPERGMQEEGAYCRQSSSGMMRTMNWSNSGTVKAVSPWLGLQTMPLPIN